MYNMQHKINISETIFVTNIMWYNRRTEGMLCNKLLWTMDKWEEEGNLHMEWVGTWAVLTQGQNPYSKSITFGFSWIVA